MTDQKLSIEDLRRLLRECAGVDGENSLDGDILDTAFADLGYDSLAMLETAGRITREYGVSLDDEIVTAARTPRALLSLVNGY
jgi:minimal PKS acyl carrier protein